MPRSREEIAWAAKTLGVPEQLILGASERMTKADYRVFETDGGGWVVQWKPPGFPEQHWTQITRTDLLDGVQTSLGELERSHAEKIIACIQGGEFAFLWDGVYADALSDG